MQFLVAADTFGILYATHIENEGFQRFCVSHELGQYLLPGHLDHLSRVEDGWHASRAGFVSTDPYELEADSCTTALLMPEPWFSQACQGDAPGLATVQRLAGLCRTSLTATAMRSVHTTTAPVALVMSRGPTIEYCFLSRALQQVAGLRRPPRRSAPPLPSATRQLHDFPRHVALVLAHTAEADLRLWFGGCQALPGLEEAIGLGRYGKTLTLLSVVDGAHARALRFLPRARILAGRAPTTKAGGEDTRGLGRCQSQIPSGGMRTRRST